jgi:predicted nuclease with TOPRIM domain
MSEAKYETVMRENMNLEREISELKECLEQERAEKEQLLEHNEDNFNQI